ncbi:hypothetical protein EES45_19440 [Streptomyces sp. ADI97-07]|nr:hypothetical protein EES45_19440 [Streptomyces sp. ADI97-07]
MKGPFRTRYRRAFGVPPGAAARPCGAGGLPVRDGSGVPVRSPLCGVGCLARGSRGGAARCGAGALVRCGARCRVRSTRGGRGCPPGSRIGVAGPRSVPWGSFRTVWAGALAGGMSGCCFPGRAGPLDVMLRPLSERVGEGLPGRAGEVLATGVGRCRFPCRPTGARSGGPFSARQMVLDRPGSPAPSPPTGGCFPPRAGAGPCPRARSAWAPTTCAPPYPRPLRPGASPLCTALLLGDGPRRGAAVRHRAVRRVQAVFRRVQGCSGRLPGVSSYGEAPHSAPRGRSRNGRSLVPPAVTRRTALQGPTTRGRRKVLDRSRVLGP